MGKVQCPYCKNISYIPSKFEGQERPCLGCGRLCVGVAFSKTDQEPVQDIEAYQEIAVDPKPMKIAPVIVIDKELTHEDVEVISNQQFSGATQRVEQSLASKKSEVNISDYSGFWRRVAAHLIDGIVLLPVSMLLPVLAKGLMVEGFLAFLASDTFTPLLLALSLNLVTKLITMVIYWFYFAKMHSSKKQATLGKMVMGIVVVDTNGNRISFARASGRYFSKILSTLILCIGFIIVAFTKRKQALHDMIAGTFVVKSEMNSSFKSKRSFVKLILIYVGVLLFTIACAYLTHYAKQYKYDESKVPVEQLTEKISSIFVMPESLGDFEVSDVTSYVRTMNPNIRIIYCVNWTIDKEHSEKWDDMNQNEKDEFIKLKKPVVEALKAGVHSLNGIFEVHDNESTGGEYGEWKLTDPKHSFPIWWVNYSFNPKSFDTGTPKISIFIKHSQIGEDENGISTGQKAVNTEPLEVPVMPSGFESVVELGEFDIFDSIEMAQEFIPTAQLSASWSAEKEYNKSWQEFTDEEKAEFDILVEKLVSKLTNGVEVNGGYFKIERPTNGLYAGSVIGRWKVLYNHKYASKTFGPPKRWRVDLNAHKTATKTPHISVFISRQIIADEE